MTLLNPPSFRTGDVLSASKTNHLLTDIDALYGWYYGPTYGIDQQQFDTTGTPSTVEGWAGWCILTGDTLVVQIANVIGGVKAKVYFDGTQIGVGTGYGAGTHQIALPTGSEGWEQWQPYRVSIVTDRPNETGELDVLRVFLKDSSIPATGPMPGFGDGEVSSASDFNAIGNGIRNVEPLVVQPVIGCRGGEKYVVQGTNTGWTTVQSWAMQHRVNGLRCSLFLQGPNSTGTISARLRYNGVVVNGAEWSVNAFGTRRVVDQIYTIPGALTVGTFYTVELQIKQSTGWLSEWYVRPDYVYEDQIAVPAGYELTTRWKHGDYAVGDGAAMGLYVLSGNLSSININATACGAVNVVQREPITTFTMPWFPNYNRRFYHVRRWRWLAYNPHSWPAQPPDTDVPGATVNWTYDGVTWDSFTLPDVDGGGFYDLDSSPIALGMSFYVSGVQFAIQTPYTYAPG